MCAALLRALHVAYAVFVFVSKRIHYQKLMLAQQLKVVQFGQMTGLQYGYVFS
jgi:hypothetical protein